uniref:Uncharacterized protein n=1 Tax=Rhizophora mucronata TaxID=61149 RepID=A0A2P2Q629_RHIMU
MPLDFERRLQILRITNSETFSVWSLLM